jgi:long-subunit fatty acid transport protein
MKQLFITVSAMLVSLAAFSQGEMDALRYSTNDLTGTARSVAMGGAFGALGGDISGIAVNPAGIGVYKSSEVAATMNFRNSRTETQLNNGAINKGKFSFSFDNMAFVGNVPTYNDDVPLVNFGFTYNRLKNFDRTYSMRSAGDPGSPGSFTDIMAQEAKGYKESDLEHNQFNKIPYESWSAVLGYNSFLINSEDAEGNTYKSILPLNGPSDKHVPFKNNALQVEEKGYIHSYDFNAGTTISDIVSLGLTIAVTDIDYRINSFYDESLNANDDGFSLYNSLRTEGSGIQVKVGAILKPVKELRLGVAYHSPTWYRMTNYFSTAIDHKLDRLPLVSKPEYKAGYFSSDVNTRDYDFSTPGKWTFSLAGVIGQTAILSFDYELTNYSSMSFAEPDKPNANMYDNDRNKEIKEDFKNSATVRAGAEVRFTPQFSARVGYAWMESPVKNVLREGSYTGNHTPAMAGPIAHFTLPKDAHHFTWGLGYKFTPQIYGDIAFVVKNQDSDLYAFGGAQKATFKNNTVSGLLTFGYRF